MILRGRYRYNYGNYRPFITGYVRSADGRWIKMSFLMDTGADETFLPYRSARILGVDTSSVEVRDDVGGIGGQDIPYFQVETELRLVSGPQTIVFAGALNIFLDPHAIEAPLLGRDILNHFSVIFDQAGDAVTLLDPPDRYEVIPG